MSILLVFTIIISLVLVGCGGGSESSSSSPSPDDSSETKDTYKVMHIVGTNLGDKSFNDSAQEGLERAKKDFGIELRVVELGADTSKFEPTVLDISETDVDMIVVSSSGLHEPVLQFADDYPDKKYICFDLGPDVEIESPNVHGIAFKQNEASFLAGAVGGKLSESGVIGFIGGQENPVINDFLVGYISGAKEANPDIKVAVSYTGNWTDTAKAKELSLAQMAQGADVIHGVAGAAGLGVIDVAKEKQIWALGVDSDQAMIFIENDPEKADRIVTSALKNCGDALYRAIELELDGKLKWGVLESVGIKEGAVGLAKNEIYEKHVSEDIRKWVADLEQKVIDGEYTVPSAFEMDNQQFQDLKNSVKP